jgi:hypothetical protein
MPTAPKLIAALLFGVLAFFVSDLVKPLLPPGTQFGFFAPVNFLVGAFLGWRISGSRAGLSMRTSLGYGLTTMAVTVFWCLFIWSGYLMVEASTRLRYDGPMQALQDMGTMMIEHAQIMATPGIIGSLLVGGLFFGWLTEQVARRYP